MAKIKSRKNVAEIPVVGEVDDWEAEAIKSMLEVPERGECVFYIDSAGGSVYGAVAIVTLLRLRQLQATAVVLGECSSAALLLFAACQRRFVTPYSTLLFHRMRWHSEKHVRAEEAQLWSQHFEQLEKDLDEFQARLFGPARDAVRAWTHEGRYVGGQQIADAGLAELIPI
jgi:ATP-dependent protease ClpP protease subunit